MIRERFNLNTALIGILIAMGAWQLKTTIAQGEAAAALTARVTNLERVVYRE